MTELRLFFIALQFLTRVPVPRWVGYEPAWLQQSARWFPAVGSVVGGGSALVLWAASPLWPPAIAVGLAMAFSIWLTGGFHEDGWADSCDGLGGAVSRERALAIMKDSRIGSYGALGLVLMLGLKAAALVALVEAGHAPAALVFAHTASRAAPVMLMRLLPYAGDVEHAKAKPLATQAGGRTLAVALLWTLALGVLLPLPAARLAIALAAVAAVTLLLRRVLRRRLGGYTGDNLGACQQLGELAVLLVFAASAR